MQKQKRRNGLFISFHLSSEWIISQSRIDMPSIITGGLKMQEKMYIVKVN